MKISQLRTLIQEEIRRVIKEERGPTEFEFDPMQFKGPNIDVDIEKEYIYRTPVGDRYVFKLKSDPRKLKMEVYRFIDHKGPDNYWISLYVTNYPDTKDKLDDEKLANLISPKLKWASGESSNTGKVNNTYSAYRLSKEEAMDMLKKYVAFTNKIK